MDTQHLTVQPNVFYTAEEVAALLRVSLEDVLLLLESGVARGLKIGPHWRVLGNDLLQLPQQEEVTDDQIRNALMRLSEPILSRVWDNEEDALYDHL